MRVLKQKDKVLDLINRFPTKTNRDIAKDGERLLGTCLELKNIFVDGTNKEDVMRKMRIVIEELFESQDVEDKRFNLNENNQLGVLCPKQSV